MRLIKFLRFNLAQYLFRPSYRFSRSHLVHFFHEGYKIAFSLIAILRNNHENLLTIASTPMPNKRGLVSAIVCSSAGYAPRYSTK